MQNQIEQIRTEDFSGWAEVFKPEVNPLGDSGIFVEDTCITFTVSNMRLMKDVDPSHVWTLIECEVEECELADDDDVDDTVWTLVAGYHHVNRIGYVVTKVPHTNSQIQEVIYG